MRRNGLPDRHDIDRCVDVSVVGRAATQALPVSDRQRHVRLKVPAARARLTRRIPTVDTLNSLTVAFGLFFEHAGGTPNARVRQRTRKAVVLQHSAQVEVFDVDHVKALHHARAEFVQGVDAAVGDLFVQTSDVALDVRSALAALGAAGKALLVERESALPLCAVFRVGNLFAGRQRGKAVDAEVDPDRLPGFGQWGRLRFDNERHEVFAAGLADQTDGGRGRNRLTRPLHLHRTDLRQFQRLGLWVEREPALGVIGRLRAVLALECRISGALVEEVRERDLQIAQGLLQTDTGDFVEPRGFGLSLECSQAFVGFRVANALTGPIAVTAKAQCPVPDEPHAAERPRKVLRLFGRWIAAEGPSGFHDSHSNELKCENQRQRPRCGRPLYLPGLNAGASRGFW